MGGRRIMVTERPANGATGYLIRTGDTVVFRVYDKNHDFVDYDITHYDCEIEIVDSSAELVRNAHGDFLDYTRESLGIDEPND